DHFGEELELEPKGGQVVALERFEAISGVMESGSLALWVTFIVGLFFLIGITATMHIQSKTGDIGILRTYGVSPLSIAWVYGLEMTMLMLPACACGILASAAASWRLNDWVARTVVLTTGPGDAENTAAAAATEVPKVFLNLQLGWLDNLWEAGQTLSVVLV